jgi:hypothetical protein
MLQTVLKATNLLMLILVPSALAGTTLTANVQVSAVGPLAPYENMSTVTTTVDEQLAEVVTAQQNDPGYPEVSIVDLDEGTITVRTGGASETIDIIDRSDELYALYDQLNADTEGLSLPFDKQSCRWGRTSVKSKTTDEFRRLNRKKAYRTIVSSNQTCSIPETGQQCTLNWSLDAWVAPRDRDQEISDFYESYGEELGVSAWIPRLSREAQTLISLFSNRWEMMFDEVQKIDGTPLELNMSVVIGQRGCLATKGSSMWDESLAAARRAGAAGVGQAVGGAASEALGNSVGGSIGSSVVGSAAGSLFGSLGKSKPKPAAQGSQLLTLYKIDWTTTNIDSSDDIVVKRPTD